VRIIDIRDAVVNLESPGKNALVDHSRMTTSVVAIVTDVTRNGERLVGRGFSSVGRYSQHCILHERLIPRILEADPLAMLGEDDFLDPERIWKVMMRDEKPGGHGERGAAVGAIDMALYDLVGKLHELPLFALLKKGHSPLETSPRITAYAAGGYYSDGKTLKDLRDEVKQYREAGFTVIKIKIGGAALRQDLLRVNAAVEVLGDPARLALDANGALEPDEAEKYADQLQPYGLAWLEELGDPLDFDLQRRLRARYNAPMATGENLFSSNDVLNLVRYGGLVVSEDILQMDPALSYGVVEYKKMLRILQSHGWTSDRCIPHGGHLFNAHVAAGLDLGGCELYPNAFGPLCDLTGVTLEGNQVVLPELPGIGWESSPRIIDTFRRTVG
jgi:D(-)-tartrate dehydratase